MPLNDTEISELEKLHSRKALNDAEISRLEQLQGQASGSAPAGITTPEPEGPGIIEAAKMGFAERELPEGASFGENVAHFAGENILPMAGSMIGAAGTVPAWLPSGGTAAAAGIGVGAAAGRQWQKNLAQVALPQYASPETPGQGALGAAKEGALYAAGEGALRVGGKAIRAVSRNIVPPVVATVTGAGRRAVDALVNDVQGVMKYIGVKPEEVAAGAQELQGVLLRGKSSVEAGYKKLLGRHHEDLVKAAREADEYAKDLDTQAVTLGQAFQRRIPELQAVASKEYRGGLEQLEQKYAQGAGGVTVDLATGTRKAVSDIGRDYGFAGKELPPGMKTAAKEFRWYADRAAALDKAGIGEARQYLNQLNLAIRNNTTTTGLNPLGSALAKLKDSVSTTIDGASPEIREMAKRYAEKKEILAALSGDANANVVAGRIRSYFKTGGNQKDALLAFSEKDPQAAELLGKMLDLQHQAADIAARSRETGKLAEVFGNIKATYQLGKGKDTLVKLAEQDPVMADILKRSAGQEARYSRLASILNSDNPAAAIERIMSEGGNKADALKELAEESPLVKDMILDVQRRVYGAKFSPWFRELPGTGYTPGLAQAAVGAVGGYNAAQGNYGSAGLGAGLLAASSPRLAAKAIAAGVRASGAAGKALSVPAVRMPVARTIGAGVEGLGEMLGIFQRPEDVQAAYESGQISPEQAHAVMAAKWPELTE